MSLKRKINLRENESIVRTVHRYTLVDWWRYVLGFAFLAAASFWMFQLFSYKYWGYTAYGILILTGLYTLFRTWFFGYFNALIISTERIVDLHRQGWFDVTMSSISYKDIKDVLVRKKGVCANIFDYGTVITQSKSEQFVLEVIKTKNPAELQTLLQDLQEQYITDRKLIDVKTIYNNFIKIIPDLDDQKLRHISEIITNELDIEDIEGDEEEEEEDETE